MGLMIIHVQVCQQCIVGGGVRVWIREQRKIKGTTNPFVGTPGHLSQQYKRRRRKGSGR